MLSLKEIKYINAYIWWSYSLVSMIPLCILSIYKLVKPRHVHKHNDITPLKRSMQDKIALLFLFWGPIYYIFDSILALFIGNFDSCSFSFFLHHLISWIFLPAVILQSYYPWFICLVPSIHALLLIFPEIEWLNYIYLAVCFLYQYGLYQEPYKNMKKYKFLQIGTWILEVVLVMLWMFGCKNTFDSLAY